MSKKKITRTRTRPSNTAPSPDDPTKTEAQQARFDASIAALDEVMNEVVDSVRVDVPPGVRWFVMLGDGRTGALVTRSRFTNTELVEAFNNLIKGMRLS